MKKITGLGLEALIGDLVATRAATVSVLQSNGLSVFPEVEPVDDDPVEILKAELAVLIMEREASIREVESLRKETTTFSLDIVEKIDWKAAEAAEPEQRAKTDIVHPPAQQKGWIAPTATQFGQEAEKRGVLLYQGKRRFCVSKKDYLMWFDMQRIPVLKGCICLAGCDIDVRGGGMALILTAHSPTRSLAFACKEQQDGIEWLRALKLAIVNANARAALYLRAKLKVAPTHLGCQGWLKKKGSDRFFVLRGDVLMWFSEEPDGAVEVEKVKGSVTMTPACFAGGAVEIFGQSMGRDIDQCFFICTSKGQTYGLSAQNPMVLKTWVAALNDLIGNFDISDVAATTSGQLDGGSTSVEKAGWLTKQGQKRWFLIRNDLFVWFEREQPPDYSDTAQNSIHLAGCAVDSVKEQDTSIVLNTDRQAKGKYVLNCQSANEKREWMAALQEAISQANYNRMRELEAPTRSGWLTVKGSRSWCHLKNNYLMWYPSDPYEDRATISAKVGTRFFGRPEEKKGVKLRGSLVLNNCAVSQPEPGTIVLALPGAEVRLTGTPAELALWAADIRKEMDKRRQNERRHILLSQQYFEQFWSLFSRPPFTLLTTLCKVFENVELISSIVHLFTYKDLPLVLDLLNQLMSAEIENTVQATTLFRTDSVATKMVRAFLKDVAGGYLKATLLPGINLIAENPRGYEMDPSKIQQEDSLHSNGRNLEEKAQAVLNQILASGPQVPPVIRSFLSRVRASVGRKFPESQLKSLNGFFFLRFLCPAIFTPEGFGILGEAPKPEARRALTLVAKVIQNTANEAKFGGKEEFMAELNPFVEANKERITAFLDQISTVEGDSQPLPFDNQNNILQRDLSVILQNSINQLNNLETALKGNADLADLSRLLASQLG